MKKRIGLVLSGCGVKDGSEIHEAVAALLAIDRSGAQVVCMAPDTEFEVVNHLTGQPTGEKRKVLLESARIARGDIQNMAEIKAANLDALIFPGGFGAVKNLSDFATKGAKATVFPEVIRLLKEMIAAKKPVGGICIAPATIAAVLGGKIHPSLTIGTDPNTAEILEQLGAQHELTSVDEVVIDSKNKIVSTSAYMLAKNISEVFYGIEKLVKEVIKLS